MILEDCVQCISQSLSIINYGSASYKKSINDRTEMKKVYFIVYRAVNAVQKKKESSFAADNIKILKCFYKKNIGDQMVFVVL